MAILTISPPLAIMALFKTFQAKIYGTIAPYTPPEPAIDEMITFSKFRIILKEGQINRIFYTTILQQPVTHRAEYEFDKILNRNDEKKFAIILKQKLNHLDTGIHLLDISTWNKFRANVIHKRYWIQKNEDWALKAIIGTLIITLTGLLIKLIFG